MCVCVCVCFSVFQLYWTTALTNFARMVESTSKENAKAVADHRAKKLAKKQTECIDLVEETATRTSIKEMATSLLGKCLEKETVSLPDALE